MRVTDFSRSFLTFRINAEKISPTTMSHAPIFRVNNARIAIECCCQITEKQTGRTFEFFLGANCKCERVGVKQDVWTRPYCDFVPAFSRDRFLILKTFDTADRQIMTYPPSLGLQRERYIGEISKAFESVRIDIHGCEGTALQTTEETVTCVLTNHPMVGLTQLDEERYFVELEYPIRTINASETDCLYQTDTGPVLYPDLSMPAEQLIEGLQLAFAAFNGGDWIEFIVRAKTPVADGVSVYHFCEPRRHDAKNTLIQVRNR
jgi:hypothetical protein